MLGTTLLPWQASVHFSVQSVQEIDFDSVHECKIISMTVIFS